MDIHSEIPLTIFQAILGCKLTINTVDGRLSIEVPSGTQNGQKMELQQYGSYQLNPPDGYDENSLRGNHIVTFKVMPLESEISDDEKELWKKYAILERQGSYYGPDLDKLK